MTVQEDTDKERNDIMSKMIKVVLAEPGKKAKATEIENTLENLQKIVGGYIECIYPFEDNVGIICNEEGKLIGLEPNRVLRDENGNAVDIIFGTFIVTGLTEDDFGSLTDEQTKYYAELFRCPESIIRTGNGFVALKIEE